MNLKIRVDHLDREGLDDRPLPPPPPYLKVWIRHWLVTDGSRIGSQKMLKFVFLPSVSCGSAKIMGRFGCFMLYVGFL